MNNKGLKYEKDDNSLSLSLALILSGSLFASAPEGYRRMSPGRSFNSEIEEPSSIYQGYARPLNEVERNRVQDFLRFTAAASAASNDARNQAFARRLQEADRP